MSASGQCIKIYKPNSTECFWRYSEKRRRVSQPIVQRPINRPPKPHGSALGPYYQFLTTNLDDKMQCIGSE
jgi:hypothetical protein